jgi:5-methylcytosine-specific restriction endonuclease McrA
LIVAYNAKKNRNRRTLNTRQALEHLFKGRKHRPCRYAEFCGQHKLTLATASFDHIVPLSQGGYDKTSNGAITCRACNARKGSMTHEQFVKLLSK